MVYLLRCVEEIEVCPAVPERTLYDPKPPLGSDLLGDRHVPSADDGAAGFLMLDWSRARGRA
jgi:hypothetical protein